MKWMLLPITLTVGVILLYVEHEVLWAFAGVAWNSVSATGGPLAPLMLVLIGLVVLVAGVAGVVELIKHIGE